MKRGLINRLLLCVVVMLSIFLMKSNNAFAGYVRISTGGTAYHSSCYSTLRSGDKAFDWDLSTYWLARSTNSWVKYKLPTAMAVTAYKIYPIPTTARYAPKAWKLQGWNGSSWVTLDSQSGYTSWTAGTAKTFYISNNTAYQYYRLYITQTNPYYYGCSWFYYTGISELALYTYSYPTISYYTATDTSINIGASTGLYWSVYYATDVTISNVGSVGASGSTYVSPRVNTTYKLTATGVSGTRTKSITININAPSLSISLNRYATKAGDPVTLTWSATNVTSVSINQGVGAIYSNSSGISSKSGTVSLTPTNTKKYTVTSTGPGGTKSKSFTVTVYPDVLDYDEDGIPDWYELQENDDFDQDEGDGNCNCD